MSLFSDPSQKRTPADEATFLQRLAASPTHSAWVSANAGSGKTRVLVDRVARLLMAGVAPSRILCLTYTKAAAAEMMERLYKTLGEWAFKDDHGLQTDLSHLQGEAFTGDLAPVRRLFARALETPGGLKIQTIHAFCQSVLARFPLEAGVPFRFSVLEETSGKDMVREALEGLHARAARGEDVALTAAYEVLATQVYADDLSNHLLRLQEDKDLSKVLRAGASSVGEWLGGALKLQGPDDEAGLVAHTVQATPLAPLREAMDVLAAGTPTDQDQADRLAAFLEDPTSERFLSHYLQVFRKKDGGPRKSLMTKKNGEQNPAVLKLLNEEAERVDTFLGEQSKRRVLARTRALLTIGARAKGLVDQVKREQKLLGFSDIIRSTEALLARSMERSWVLYRLDGGVEHVLVDEAQDTSPEQWAILRHITEELFAGEGVYEAKQGQGLARSFFAVGDEKQSIYSFQGAEPAAFEAMRTHFQNRISAAGGDFRAVNFEVSFRSAPNILRAVDQVFGSDTVAVDGLSADGNAPHHQAARAGDGDGDSTGFQGLVELWPTLHKEDQHQEEAWDAPRDQLSRSDPSSRLAERIVERIRTLIDQEIPAEGKPLTYGDMLVLVRQRGPLVSHLIRALKRAHIPVAGADRMKLAEELVVEDLLILADFALFPCDDLALATVLKSPLGNFSDEDLMDLCLNRPEAISLWAHFKATAGEAHQPLLAALHQLIDRAPAERPFDFFSRLLNQPMPGAVSLKQAILTRLGRDAEEPLSVFLAEALAFETRSVPSVQSFLASFRGSEIEIKREMEKGVDAVRIMTVHGAKGLEAPVVFLPDTWGVPSASKDAALTYLPPADDQAPPAMLWATGDERKLLDDTKDRAEADQQEVEREYHRLLYVAMTRARDQLYIAGFRGKELSEQSKNGRKADRSWYKLVEAALLKMEGVEKVPNGEGDILRLGQLPRALDGGAREKTDTEDFEKPDWLYQPAPFEPPPDPLLAPSRVGQARVAPDEVPANPPRSGGNPLALARGRLVHTLLQYLPDVEEADREAAALRFLQASAPGLSIDQAHDLWREVAALLSDDAFAPLFGRGSRAEVPLAGRVPGLSTPVAGRIDRLVVTSAQVLALDFKTNRLVPPGLDQVPVSYLRQLKVYTLLLKGVFPDRQIRSAFLWTDAPLLMPVPSERLEALTLFDPAHAESDGQIDLPF